MQEMTRPKNRQAKILESLGILWMQVPNFRFCQMIENITHEIKKEGRDIFYLEDDEFLELINKALEKLQNLP